MLPERVLVKISSEAAGPISVTPVVAEDMPLRALLEVLLGIAGKDPVRLRDLLAGGAAVQGASRFRWEKIDADLPSIDAALAGFPDSDPQRAFDAERCFQVQLVGRRGHLEIPREVASRKRLFARGSFWSALMQLASSARPRYVEYSYRSKADEYKIELSVDQSNELIAAARLLKYSGLCDHVQRLELRAVQFSVRR
jgi:hypothetical protein